MKGTITYPMAFLGGHKATAGGGGVSPSECIVLHQPAKQPPLISSESGNTKCYFINNCLLTLPASMPAWFQFAFGTSLGDRADHLQLGQMVGSTDECFTSFATLGGRRSVASMSRYCKWFQS